MKENHESVLYNQIIKHIQEKKISIGKDYILDRYLENYSLKPSLYKEDNLKTLMKLAFSQGDSNILYFVLIYFPVTFLSSEFAKESSQCFFKELEKDIVNQDLLYTLIRFDERIELTNELIHKILNKICVKESFNLYDTNNFITYLFNIKKQLKCRTENNISIADYYMNDNKETLFFQAVISNNAPLVKLLISEKANIYHVNKDNKNVLHKLTNCINNAVDKSQFKEIEKILELIVDERLLTYNDRIQSPLEFIYELYPSVLSFFPVNEWRNKFKHSYEKIYGSLWRNFCDIIEKQHIFPVKNQPSSPTYKVIDISVTYESAKLQEWRHIMADILYRKDTKKNQFLAYQLACRKNGLFLLERWFQNNSNLIKKFPNDLLCDFHPMNQPPFFHRLLYSSKGRQILTLLLEEKPVLSLSITPNILYEKFSNFLSPFQFMGYSCEALYLLYTILKSNNHLLPSMTLDHLFSKDFFDKKSAFYWFSGFELLMSFLIKNHPTLIKSILNHHLCEYSEKSQESTLLRLSIHKDPFVLCSLWEVNPKALSGITVLAFYQHNKTQNISAFSRLAHLPYHFEILENILRFNPLLIEKLTPSILFKKEAITNSSVFDALIRNPKKMSILELLMEKNSSIRASVINFLQNILIDFSTEHEHVLFYWKCHGGIKLLQKFPETEQLVKTIEHYLQNFILMIPNSYGNRKFKLFAPQLLNRTLEQIQENRYFNVSL